MARQKGSDCLLKMDITGSGSFSTIGGIQNARIKLDRPDVDVTAQDSPSKHRQLLEGASIFKLSVSGDGVFESTAPQPTLHSVMMAGTIRNWQIVVAGLGTYSGAFQITSLEFGSSHEKEVTMSIALESGGVVSFA